MVKSIIHYHLDALAYHTYEQKPAEDWKDVLDRFVHDCNGLIAVAKNNGGINHYSVNKKFFESKKGYFSVEVSFQVDYNGAYDMIEIEIHNDE